MFLLVLFCESVGGRRHKYEAPANEAVHAIYVRVNVPFLCFVLVLVPDHIDHTSTVTLFVPDHIDHITKVQTLRS